jgi:hypothetical protein
MRINTNEPKSKISRSNWNERVQNEVSALIKKNTLEPLLKASSYQLQFDI